MQNGIMFIGAYVCFLMFLFIMESSFGTALMNGNPPATTVCATAICMVAHIPDVIGWALLSSPFILINWLLITPALIVIGLTLASIITGGGG